MKPTIKILAISTFSLLNVFAGFGQAITVAYGPAYTVTKQIVPLVNGQNGGLSGANTAYVFSICYEHFLTDNPISLSTSFSKYDGYTFMFFEKGGVIEGNGQVNGVGFNGVTVKRFDLGVSYCITNSKKKFYFRPFVALGVQCSKKNGQEIYSELLNANGPYYFQLEPISAAPRSTTQFTPSGGFRTGFLFWKRLDVSLNFQGVYGHKAYQRMYFKYEYKGTPQPTAEFEANGTGLFVTLGIGYRFAKLIK